MKGATVAAALLLASLAFALAFVPRRTALGAGALAALAMGTVYLALPPASERIAFAVCWVSLVVVALNVFWPQLIRRSLWPCLALAAAAGCSAGVVIATTRGGLELFWPALALLLVEPAIWTVERGWGIGLRVMTSWFLAVALLVGAIPHLVAHPGYVSDHRE